MVGLETLLSIDGVVAAGIVRAVHPDLRDRNTHWVPTLLQNEEGLLTLIRIYWDVVQYILLTSPR